MAFLMVSTELSPKMTRSPMSPEAISVASLLSPPSRFVATMLCSMLNLSLRILPNQPGWMPA